MADWGPRVRLAMERKKPPEWAAGGLDRGGGGMGWKSLLKREPLLGGFCTSVGSSLSSVLSQSSSYLHLFLVGGTLIR